MRPKMTPEMPPGRPRKACELIFTAQSARKAILLIKLMENALDKSANPPPGQEEYRAPSPGPLPRNHLILRGKIFGITTRSRAMRSALSVIRQRPAPCTADEFGKMILKKTVF